MSEETGIKDFSRPRRRVRFRIDGDLFEAAPALPAETLVQFASRFSDLESIDQTKRFDVLVEVLELVLLPESFALLRRRMSDRTDPVELDQLNDVIVHLLETFGLRPTQPSSGSPDGREAPESGMSLTDAA